MCCYASFNAGTEGAYAQEAVNVQGECIQVSSINIQRSSSAFCIIRHVQLAQQPQLNKQTQICELLMPL